MLEEGLRISRRSGDRFGLAYSILGLACLAADLGDWRRAAELHGVAQAFLDQIGQPWLLYYGPLRQVSIDEVSEHLGDEEFQRAYAKGKSARFRRGHRVGTRHVVLAVIPSRRWFQPSCVGAGNKTKVSGYRALVSCSLQRPVFPWGRRPHKSGPRRGQPHAVHQMGQAQPVRPKGSRPQSSPNGIRTRVSTLRGWCPWPLDDGAGHPFGPSQTIRWAASPSGRADARGDVPVAGPGTGRKLLRAVTRRVRTRSRRARAPPEWGPRGKLARGGGLEPPITGPEPAVLPITPPPNG